MISTMISDTTLSNYTNGTQVLPIYGVHDDQEVLNFSSLESNSSNPPTQQASSNFLNNLSILKDKVHQVQSLASMFISTQNHIHQSTVMIATPPSMATLIQEIILTASSMMFSCQQMSLGSPAPTNNNDNVSDGGPLAQLAGGRRESGPFEAFFPTTQDNTAHQHMSWYAYNNCNSNDANNYNSTTNLSTIVADVCNNNARNLHPKREITTNKRSSHDDDYYDIIELGAADLLAKYTHYCQVCSKGFKRDANLRMHMRAHGDEYKSNAALINPLRKSATNTSGLEKTRKYSCPQQGCRWNKNHPNFQPLKSMICAKNHYKRSHCPKMYVCKMCNRKQFSVLSDLRTHEKHCGVLKWMCSCGTTFSRKDKLMGHVSLFVGHTPAVMSSSLNRAGDGSH